MVAASLESELSVEVMVRSEGTLETLVELVLTLAGVTLVLELDMITGVRSVSAVLRICVCNWRR